jgi:hypothetical protein
LCYFEQKGSEERIVGYRGLLVVKNCLLIDMFVCLLLGRACECVGELCLACESKFQGCSVTLFRGWNWERRKKGEICNIK